MPLTYVIPQYHVLIPKPVDQGHKERLLCFDADAESFLKESSRKDASQVFRDRSETWIILFTRLTEMLRQNRI